MISTDLIDCVAALPERQMNNLHSALCVECGGTRASEQCETESGGYGSACSMRFLPELTRRVGADGDPGLSLYEFLKQSLPLPELLAPKKKTLQPLKPGVSPEDDAVKELEAAQALKKSDGVKNTELPPQLSRFGSLPTIEFDGERLILVRPDGQPMKAADEVQEPGQRSSTLNHESAAEVSIADADKAPSRSAAVLPPRPEMDAVEGQTHKSSAEGLLDEDFYERPTFRVDVYAEAPRESDENHPEEISEFEAEVPDASDDQADSEDFDGPTFSVDVYAEPLEESETDSTQEVIEGYDGGEEELVSEVEGGQFGEDVVLDDKGLEEANVELLDDAHEEVPVQLKTEEERSVEITAGRSDPEDLVAEPEVVTKPQSKDLDFEEWIEWWDLAAPEEEPEVAETIDQEFEEAWEPELCEEICVQAEDEADHTGNEISDVAGGLSSGHLSADQAENALHEIEEEILDLESCGPEAQSKKEKLQAAAAALRVAISQKREAESKQKEERQRTDRERLALPGYSVNDSNK